MRTIDRNVTSQSGNNIWRRSAFDEFRRNANEIDADRTAQLVQEAADITFHLESVTAHKVSLQLRQKNCLLSLRSLNA